MKTTQIASLKRPGDLLWIWARMDKQDLPFKDIRVRQALNMAIDRQSLVTSYYGGNADAYSSPWPNSADYAPFYTPLDQQDQAVKDLFSYNPTKAKQLLADAGYPNGFKTSVVCTQASSDFLSIIKGNFSAIGVDMQINMLDTGVYSSVSLGRTFPEMIYSIYSIMYPYKMLAVRSETTNDPAFFESQQTRDAYNQINAVIGKDPTKVNQIIKGISPFMLEQATGVMLPQQYNYTLWWPWVRNYHGEQNGDGGFSPMYVWIDQAMKSSLGH